MTTTSQSSAVSLLCIAIRNGEFDEHLKTIARTVELRQKDRRNYSMYPIGSMVRLNSSCSPQYLRGALARVVSHERSSGGKFDLKVELVYGVRRYQAGVPLRVPFSIVDPVE